MTYHNAIKFIKTAPAEAPKESSASKRIADLCTALGNPQKKIKYVRLAGSNGKTVCARMLISILNSAKVVNGCLSMPVYEEIRDNIRINGEPISMEETVRYVERICQAVNEINSSLEEDTLFRPTCNEIMLCISLLAFAEHKCDVCILEGDHYGEDPSRHIIPPIAAIICGRIPNGDKEEIAKIRSYICRGIREIVSVPQNQDAYKIISDTCFSVNCRLSIPSKSNFTVNRLTLRNTAFTYKGTEYSLRLCGKFQTANAVVAIEGAEMLVRAGYAINPEHIKEGLAAVTAPCKFEVVSIMPTIIADSTHSPVAIEVVCDSLVDFKEMTGTKIKLCLPEGELIDQYIDALENRGYSIKKIFALAADNTDKDLCKYSITTEFKQTAKLTAKNALAGLENDEILLISGPSNFTRKIRYELLAILGF